jgi:hypothetical protein
MRSGFPQAGQGKDFPLVTLSRLISEPQNGHLMGRRAIVGSIAMFQKQYHGLSF